MIFFYIKAENKINIYIFIESHVHECSHENVQLHNRKRSVSFIR